MKRVKAPKLGHNLAPALEAIERAGLKMDLTQGTREFIAQIDQVGQFRYMEVSFVVWWRWIMSLDRAVWELRRFCTSAPHPRTLKLVEGEVAPRYALDGHLEAILAKRQNPARKHLLWHNGFLGRKRRKVTVCGSFIAINSPLFNKPELLDTLLQYVYIPREIADGYRDLAKQRAAERAAKKKP